MLLSRQAIIIISSSFLLLILVGFVSVRALIPNSDQEAEQEQPAVERSIQMNRGIRLNGPPLDIKDYKVKVNDPNDYSQYAPTNPRSVLVFTDADKAVPVKTGTTASYASLYIEWEPAVANEPGTEIVGYMVYLGEGVTDENLAQFSPITRGIRIDDTKFDTRDFGIVFEKGKKYTLLIQAFGNGRAKFGFDRDVQAPSKKYFEYMYEN